MVDISEIMEYPPPTGGGLIEASGSRRRGQR